MYCDGKCVVHPDFSEKRGDCRDCWRKSRINRNVKVIKSISRISLLTKSPCRWEGEIIQECKTCNTNSPNRENRHIRKCLHPNADLDHKKCCRNHPNLVSSIEIQNCSNCDDYELK